MSTRTSDERARSRAEARRRARLVARGDLLEQEHETADAPVAERAAGGGFLGKLFPPAPPLPNRPDPLAGFDRSGSLRPVRERIFLLRHNLLAWLIPAVVACVGFFASISYGQSMLSLLGTFVLFGALIAAGWFGWQRPTLFGFAAGLLGYLLAAGLILVTFATNDIPPEYLGTPTEIATSLLVQGLYPAGVGFLGGWYGGYLRRRQTQLSAETRRRR
jgi:hypothetical protein